MSLAGFPIALARAQRILRARALWFFLSLCSATTVAAQQQSGAAPPIRALYVTGGGFHDFTA